MKLAGVTGGLALGAGPVAAQGSSDNQRFMIDLREVSRSAIPESVEIVHDLSAIDVLAARGDPESVGSEAATVPDVEMTKHGSAADGSLQGDVKVEAEGGPVKEYDDEDGDGEESALPDRRRLQWDKRAQDVEDVHEVTKGDGSRIAIIDSGVYADHPDLDEVVNRELSKNFTDDGKRFFLPGAGDHGTHVAGIAAATNDYDGERGGVLGVAPETDLLALRVFSATGGGATSDIVKAIMYAADKGSDAANMSLGFPEPLIIPENYPALLQTKMVFDRAVAYANERGTVVVNSAGNDGPDPGLDGTDLDPKKILGIPTEAEGVFAVSATGPIGFLWDDEPRTGEDDEDEGEYEGLPPLRQPTTQPAKYTFYGGSVLDVSAGGGNFDPEAAAEFDDGDADKPKYFYDLVISSVFSQQNGEVSAEYGFKAGTSMAAPQVTGAVALARSLRPDLGVREVEAAIRDTASDIGEPDYRGDGHLDLTALVARLSDDEEDEDDDEDEDDEEERDEEEDEGDDADGEDEEEEEDEDDD